MRELLGYLLAAGLGIFLIGMSLYMMLMIFYPSDEAIRLVKPGIAIITGVVGYFAATAYQSRLKK